MLEKKKKSRSVQSSGDNQSATYRFAFYEQQASRWPTECKKKKICQCIAIYTEFEMYFNRH